MPLDLGWLMNRYQSLANAQQQEDEEAYLERLRAQQLGTVPRAPWIGERGYTQSVQRRAELGELGAALGRGGGVRVFATAGEPTPRAASAMPEMSPEAVEARQFERNLRSDVLRQNQLALRQLAAAARAAEQQASDQSLYGAGAAYSPVRRQELRQEQVKDLEAQAEAELRRLWGREPYEEAVSQRRLREIYERYGRPAEVRGEATMGAAELRAAAAQAAAQAGIDAATLQAFSRVATGQPLTPEDRQRIQSAYERLSGLIPSGPPGQPPAKEITQDQWETLRELLRTSPAFRDLSEDDLLRQLRTWGYVVRRES
jgi:hypothetical protein